MSEHQKYPMRPRVLFPKSPTPESDSSPLPKKGRGLRKQNNRKKIAPKFRQQQGEAAKVLEPTLRQQMLHCKFLKLQSTEDRGGVSVSGEENSSDDAHLPDLECVSQGNHHPNAQRHVYLNTVLPPPLHEQRYEGRQSLAGSF
jgi:hypothetical protein